MIPLSRVPTAGSLGSSSWEGREMSTMTTEMGTALECRDRLDATIASLENDMHRRWLQNWRDHWWAEVICDLDTIIGTLAPDPVYRLYGTSKFGPPVEINTTEEARAMYQSTIDQGVSPAGRPRDERWAFGDWGLTLECQHTIIFTGAMLAYADASLDADGLYRVTHRMSTLHPYDERALMMGEILYFSDPLAIEPTDRAELDRFLGR
jgi:hypothetical protein